MDDYMVLDAMSPGSFGTAVLVKDRQSNLELTLKKVECLDEGRANKALEEARCLLDIKHPYIVKYRKLFITWDQTISSVFLSLVMDCPYRCTLASMIGFHRDRKQKIKNQVITMFLGQMVDALAYLHERKIAHRNLKPSNIQVTDDHHFLLFDFGTATITGDRVKMQRRVKETVKCWLSPESVSLSQWTEKSDIWALGCVLLDMLTCHVLEADVSRSQLVRLRQDKAPLDLVTHEGLTQVLSVMLHQNPADRASVWELVNKDLVKNCLQRCGSSLHTRKRTLPPGVQGPPFQKGFDSVLEFMQTYTGVESVQQSVLSFLLSDQDNVFYRLGDVMQAVTVAMQRHLDSPEVLLEACQVAQSRISAALSRWGGVSGGVCSRELVSAVLLAVLTHPGHAQLRARGLLLLGNLAEHEQAVRDVLVDQRVAREVVSTLRKFPGERDVITSCCRCLLSILGPGACVDRSSLMGAVECVCVAADTHMQDSVVMECVCAALCSLTQQGVSEDKDVEDCVLLLMRALTGHRTHSRLVKSALLALTNLLNTSELSALRLLVAPDGGRGLALIQEVRRQHCDDAEVVGSVCGLLGAMAQYGEVVPEMASDGVIEELELVEEQFAANQEVTLLVRLALVRIRDSGHTEETNSA